MKKPCRLGMTLLAVAVAAACWNGVAVDAFVVGGGTARGIALAYGPASGRASAVCSVRYYALERRDVGREVLHATVMPLKSYV